MSDEFEIYYRSYLDNHYPNDRCPSDDSPYSHNRDFYTLKAYERAFGQREDSWNPMFGFNQNENFIRKLYEYYKNLQPK